MIDPSVPLAAGLAGFLCGMAYAGRNHMATLRDAVISKAIIVDRTAYLLVPVYPEPGGKVSIEKTMPKAELVVLPGGKGPEDAA